MFVVHVNLYAHVCAYACAFVGLRECVCVSGLCSNALAFANASANAAFAFALALDSFAADEFALAFAFDSSAFAFALAFDSNAFD